MEVDVMTKTEEIQRLKEQLEDLEQTLTKEKERKAQFVKLLQDSVI